MTVTRRFGATLFAFGVQIYFFHPDDMLNHLLLEYPSNKIIANAGIIDTLKKFDFSSQVLLDKQWHD